MKFEVEVLNLQIMCFCCISSILEENGPLTETVAYKYFADLINGVQQMQEKDIAHNDLEPFNLLIDESDNLKITDFGQAAKASSANSSDIENCGKILYWMVTKRPFQKQKFALRWANMGVSEHLKNLVKELTDKNQRLTVEEIRNHPWMKSQGQPRLMRQTTIANYFGKVSRET